MADTKTSDFSTLTAAALAAGDALVWLDVSDTTHGATGTLKRMVQTEVAALIGLATATLTNKTFDANGTGNSLSNVETADIVAASKSGADATLITGTAGTDGNLAAWNADGDIVDGGVAVAALASESYVDAAIAALVDTAPAALDTLNELAAALGDDAAFSATVTTALAGKLAIASNLSDVNDAATAFANIKQAASESATGVVELATTAEIDAGTDTARVPSVDAFAASRFATEVVQLLVFDDSEDVATGDGAGDIFFRVPSTMNGMDLVGVAASHQTAGTGTGTDTTDIQVHNVTQTADMLSTVLTVDEDETDSATAAAAAAIDTANDDVATGDQLRIDVDAVTPTTAPKGLLVELQFRMP